MGAVATPDQPSDAHYQIPDSKVLSEAGELKIKNQDGQEIAFNSLYADKGDGERHLIVFIRHFFCGFCEEYIHALARDLPPKQLATVHTTLTIIGCGEAVCIPDYIKRTGCPYEIYCDPSRQLYEKLGMVCRLLQPGKAPKYLSKSLAGSVISSFLTTVPYALQFFKAGKISQNGGEWLFENGELKWCRRMTHPADHAETDELKQVIGL